MRDFLQFPGETDIAGSRDAIRKSFSRGIINNGEIWMDMLRDRNRTSHTYNEKTANDIATAVKSEYYDAFVSFGNEMERRLTIEEKAEQKIDGSGDAN